MPKCTSVGSIIVFCILWVVFCFVLKFLNLTAPLKLRNILGFWYEHYQTPIWTLIEGPYTTAVSLYFPAVLSLDRDVTRSGLRLGLASVPVGIASLIGTPIAGAVVGNNRWWSGAIFTGVSA